MRVGIICEGSTDFVVLEALALELLPADECVLLHPDFDKLQATGQGSGWQGVRKFLQTSVLALAMSVYDVFVIQVDASIRKLKELGLPDAESLEPLREHVRGWAGGNLPRGSAIVLPREELEAWLLAAQKKGKPAKDSSVYRKLVKPALVKLALDKKKLRQVPELELFVEQLRTHRRRAP